jgi:hypothetical protein
MSISLHRLIRASMGSFPAAFVAPSRNREYLDTLLHSAEVVTCTHKRPKPCYTTGRTFPSILLLYGAQSCDPSQSLSSSATPHTHPFVVPTLETIHASPLRIVVGPTSIDTIHAGRLPAGSFRPRFNLPTPVFYHLVFPTSVDIPHTGLLHTGSFRPRAPMLVAYNPS